MRRGLLVLFLAVLTGAASPQNTNDARPVSFDPKPWLEDFHQVLSEMSSHYANLEWAVEDRRMDLPRLRLDTEAKLREAIDEHVSHTAVVLQGCLLSAIAFSSLLPAPPKGTGESVWLSISVCTSRRRS